MADAYVLLGLVATKQNRVAEAEQLFRKAAALEPADYRTLGYIGSACLQQGRLDEAAGFFSQVLRMAPANAAAHYNLGLIDLSRGNAAEAGKHFDAVLRSDPSDVPARAGALESELILKNHAAVLRLAETIDRMLPAASADRLRIAGLLGSYGEDAAAVSILEKMPPGSPAAGDASFDLALALFHLRAYERAANSLDPALSGPQRAEALNLLADINDARQHIGAAAAEYQEAIGLQPGNEDFWFSYGLFLLRHDRAAQAVDVFERGIDRVPGSTRLQLGQGVALYTSGTYDRAVECLVKLATGKPAVTLTYYLLGEMYEAAPTMQDRVSSLIEAYIKNGPADPGAYYEFGKILFLRAQAGKDPDHGQAKRNLQRALALNPKLAEAYWQLAVVAQSEGKSAASIPLLEKALALKPGLSNARYRLALAFRKLGQDGKAAGEMEAYGRGKAEEAAVARQAIVRSLETAGRSQ